MKNHGQQNIKTYGQLKDKEIGNGDTENLGAATLSADNQDLAAQAAALAANQEELAGDLTGTGNTDLVDPDGEGGEQVEPEGHDDPEYKAREDMPLDKQIKNLQVSISIYRKEIKEKLTLMPTMKADEKVKAVARITACDKMIVQKESELEQLKILWAKEKPARATRSISVSQEEIEAAMAKYGISK